MKYHSRRKTQKTNSESTTPQKDAKQSWKNKNLQENTSVKLPYHQTPHKVMDVKGAKTTHWRGGKEKQRSRKIEGAGKRPRLRRGTMNRPGP